MHLVLVEDGRICGHLTCKARAISKDFYNDSTRGITFQALF